MTDRGEYTAHPVQADWVESGLTKREWFAGMALSGLCASAGFSEAEIARLAVVLADEIFCIYTGTKMSDTTQQVVTVEALHRTPVGDNQWIAIGVLAVTYLTATLFVVAGLGTVEWWGNFVGALVPTVTGIVIGGSALIKTAAAIRGDSPKRVTTVVASKGEGE